jgi:putative alpha-1,2-mannosidase
MKIKILALSVLLMIFAPSQVVYGDTSAKPETPVDYVNLYIGSINPKNRSTTPVIRAPGGAVSLFPTFSPDMEDLYLAEKIYGFPLGFGSLMINTGPVKIGDRANASRFDHDLETATPYYYQALLEDSGVNVEYTLSADTIYFRFTLPPKQTSQILLNLNAGSNAQIKDNRTIEGSGGRDRKTYFHAELSKPAAAIGSWKKNDVAAGASSAGGAGSGLYLTFPAGDPGETVELKVGISPKSIAESRDFIGSEIASSTFDQVKDKARQLWNDELGLIKIEGGTERQRSVFYSTLYRTRALRMGNVWDTYRCAYPLQTIIKPDETAKAIRNFVAAYVKTGWLPSSGAMIGNHTASVILDAYMKGIRDFDVEKAYDGMLKNATQATMIPWRDEGHITELEQCYFDKGFYPALPVDPERVKEAQKRDSDPLNRLPYQVRWLPEIGVKEWVKEVDPWHRRQSVSVTLEHAYDDWCLAQMAKELGKEQDYQTFMKRAHNYQNVFNPAIGMMAPKSADGKWVEPFDPKASGGFAGEGYFAECNSWIYTFNVQHDVQGLINLFGGRDQFIAKLDTLFTTQHPMDKLAFLGQFPDMTGLIGMYCQGNEPAFHIPYLYNYAGQPWMTQRRVRQIMDVFYDSTPTGLCGDEDGGAMSSWYVFNAMGFYPQCPGRPLFDIGSPLFDKTTINVGNGKTFVIEARDVSARNKYIQSATLNGAPLDKPWFNNSDLVKGGALIFQMGDRPNKSWGTAPEAAAPSMSSPAGNGN